MPTATTDARTDASDKQNTSAVSALILCGGLKPPPLAEALRAPLLLLPQGTDRTLLHYWLDAFDLAGIESARCHLLTDTESWCENTDQPSSFTPIVDSGQYRGPAGVLRDAAESADLGDCCVIVESSRMLESRRAMRELLDAHRQRHESVTVATNPDGSFAGIFIADTKAIRLIPKIGFIDIKEQWLPAAAKEGFTIRSHPLSGFCFSARTAKGYLAALGRMGWFEPSSESRTIGPKPPSVFGTRYGGSLIFNTARVAPDAVVSCSSVGDGATLEEGSVVIRSIIGPRARVAKNDVIIDTVIPAADDLSHQRSTR